MNELPQSHSIFHVVLYAGELPHGLDSQFNGVGVLVEAATKWSGAAGGLSDALAALRKRQLRGDEDRRSPVAYILYESSLPVAHPPSDVPRTLGALYKSPDEDIITKSKRRTSSRSFEIKSGQLITIQALGYNPAEKHRHHLSLGTYVAYTRWGASNYPAVRAGENDRQ